jgi:hypothetical protein
VYRGPCIAPEGALPNGIGPIFLAGSEKISLYFPLSPNGSMRATGATCVIAETGWESECQNNAQYDGE